MEFIRKTVVSCTTRRGLSTETLGSVQSCQFKGVSLTQGITDVALARCVQFKSAVEAMREQRAEFVLFVDDDMWFRSEDAEKVIGECAAGRLAVSGRYVSGNMENAKLAATKMPETAGAPAGRYLTGLGFLAAPRELIERVLDKTPRVKWNGQTIPGVTACGPVGDTWISEDFMLCMALGGVGLSSVEVGHVKPCILKPSMFAHLKEPEAPKQEEPSRIIIPGRPTS